MCKSELVLIAEKQSGVNSLNVCKSETEHFPIFLSKRRKTVMKSCQEASKKLFIYWSLLVED